MRINRLPSFLLLSLFIISNLACAAGRPRVVASFSILGDLVTQIAGDKVDLTTLVGPNGDAHVFQPSPADARKVAKADLLVVNGLEFEGWMTRLLESSSFNGVEVIASGGIEPLKNTEQDEDHDDAKEHEHEHGKFDPHAWNNVANVKIYVTNINRALGKIDPDNALYYSQRTEAYLQQLDQLDAWVKDEIGKIPEQHRHIITSHDAFGYLAAAYGLDCQAPLGMSTESEPSAADIAAIIRQIRKQHISAVFVENISDPRLIQQIAGETEAKVGGTLYSDALSSVDEPAGTYVEFVRHNINTIINALQ